MLLRLNAADPVILIQCALSKYEKRYNLQSFAIIRVPTLVPNVEEVGWDMSLTLFSPFPGSDSFSQPFINILALVVQKMGQVR